MKIEHIAIWSSDIERLKTFYQHYFGARPNKKYRNRKTNFESYFLSFDTGARLEIMQRPDIEQRQADPMAQQTGLIHFAISVGSRERVDTITSQIQADGHQLVDGPRTTGDGYYESVVLDPENNRVEITV